MTVILRCRYDITLDALRRVAWDGEAAHIDDAALRRMADARRRFLALIADPEVTVYGVTSGYGQHAKRRLAPDERQAHAKRPPTASAAAWGDPLPERVVRGIVLARLANFLDGHAAISPGVAMAVADMLKGRSLPSVPARGQGGAGEILALAPLFGHLAQHPDVAEKDVLSLINGSPAASALVGDAAIAAGRRLTLAVEVFALAAEAFDAPYGHFDPRLEDLWNNPHDAWALQELRRAMGDGGGARRPYQAPVSVRILPRMLGQAHRAYAMAADIAGESLAAVSDNPVMLPPEAGHPNGRMVSTGGYHNPHAAMAMDAVAAAHVNLITLAERLSAKLLDGAVSLLPDQLGLGNSTQYLGCLPMAIVGYEEEARMLAGATLLPGAESGGFDQNDVASPVFLAWSKQQRTGTLLEAAVASLALVAHQALVITGRPIPDPLGCLAADIGDVMRSDAAPGHLSGLIEERVRRRIFGASAPQVAG